MESWFAPSKGLPPPILTATQRQRFYGTLIRYKLRAVLGVSSLPIMIRESGGGDVLLLLRKIMPTMSVKTLSVDIRYIKMHNHNFESYISITNPYIITQVLDGVVVACKSSSGLSGPLPICIWLTASCSSARLLSQTTSWKTLVRILLWELFFCNYSENCIYYSCFIVYIYISF